MNRRAWNIVTAALLAAVLMLDLRWPARITLDIGASDTLIDNGVHPVLLGAKALNRHGWSIWYPRLRYAGLSPAIARAESDAVTCKSDGDGTLIVSRGSVEHRVFVRCRPIAGFGFGSGVQLEVGGPPAELPMNPFDKQHRAVTLLRGQASLRDSGIARFRDGLVYPVAVGWTSNRVEFTGGSSTNLGVYVKRRMLDTSLSLVAGEMETWHFPAAYYEIKLAASDSASADPSLALGVTDANCTRGREGPQHYYCITKERSAFIVKNLKAAGTRHAISGHLSIAQIPRR